MLRKLARRLAGTSKHFSKSESGSSAVEFAMVSFVFFYVLGVIFETGLMMFTEYALQASVQEAARMVRTGQVQKAGMSAAAFKAKVCETAGILIDCMGKASVYVNSLDTFQNLSSAKPAMVSVGPAPGDTSPTSSFNAGAASQASAIIVTYDWNFVLPFMDFFANIPGKKRRIVGFAVFRNEPYS